MLGTMRHLLKLFGSVLLHCLLSTYSAGVYIGRGSFFYLAKQCILSEQRSCPRHHLCAPSCPYVRGLPLEVHHSPVAGYGAGTGFFFRNLAALCGSFRVHAVDLLGTGLSGMHLPSV